MSSLVLSTEVGPRHTFFSLGEDGSLRGHLERERGEECEQESSILMNCWLESHSVLQGKCTMTPVLYARNVRVAQL